METTHDYDDWLVQFIAEYGVGNNTTGTFLRRDAVNLNVAVSLKHVELVSYSIGKQFVVVCATDKAIDYLASLN